MLLHWATGMLASPTLIGGNGEPVATSARPSVQSARSCGRASLRLVGLDSGMMIGRLACAATRRTTCSVKAPLAVDRPMSAVGWTAQRQLADRDAHAADALVTQAKNPLPVGDDDDVDLPPGPVAQDLPDAVTVGVGDEKAARTAVDLAE